MEAVLDKADKMFSGEEGHGKFLDLNKNYLTFCNIKKLRTLGLIKSEDYLTWLQNFNQFQKIPLYIKQGTQYEEYITNLAETLKDFFQRSRPLADWTEIVEQTEEMFASEWEQRSLFGWESAIEKLYGENIPKKSQGPLQNADSGPVNET